MRRCETCGRVLTWNARNGPCTRCRNKVAVAERAVIEAAERWRRMGADGGMTEAVETVQMLEDAVDALRAARGSE